MGVRLPKMTQWLQKWPLMKQKTCSGVLLKLKALTHLSLTSECPKQQHGALGWRNSRPGFCPLLAYLFIWKYHCKIYTSGAGGDAGLQNCWWFSPHQCQLSSCLLSSFPHLTGWLSLLPVLRSVCLGRLLQPRLTHSSSVPQNFPSTWQIVLQQGWKWCECATPSASLEASEDIKSPYSRNFLCNSPLADF